MSIDRFIEEQPQAVAQTLTRASAVLAEWTPPPRDRILLVGSGSSFNALASLKSALCLGFAEPVDVVNPARFLATLDDLGGQPLVVLLSQSGASTTSVAAAEAAVARGFPTLVVTAEPESPVAAITDKMVLLAIGEERIGPKTKGFSASLVAVAAILARLAGLPAPQVDADAIGRLVAEAGTAAARLAPELDNARFIGVSGSGPFHGIALEGSLKITEVAGIPSAGFETEELLHGRLHGFSRDCHAIMIAADDTDLAAARQTARAMAPHGVGVAVVNLTGTPSELDFVSAPATGDIAADTIAAVIPFQCLAVALAERRGLDPSAMAYPGLSQALAIKLGPPA